MRTTKIYCDVRKDDISVAMPEEQVEMEIIIQEPNNANAHIFRWSVDDMCKKCTHAIFKQLTALKNQMQVEG